MDDFHPLDKAGSPDMVVAGLAIIEFFDSGSYLWLGISLIPAGFLVIIIGLIRFIKKKKLIREHSLQSYEEGYLK